MQILIETQDPADASSLLKLSFNNIPIAEGLTAAHAHYIAGAILDGTIPVGRPGPESLAARLARSKTDAEFMSAPGYGARHAEAGSADQTDEPPDRRSSGGWWGRTAVLVNRGAARYAAKLLIFRASVQGWPRHVNIDAKRQR